MAEEIAVEITPVEKLKALLGLTDAEIDAATVASVEFALANAEEVVKNYCHIDEIPQGLSNTVLRMAMDIYRNEQPGSVEVPQAVSSVKIGDTTTSFKTSSTEYAESIMKNYKAVLNRYRKVEFR